MLTWPASMSFSGSSGAVRAFSSGHNPGWSTYGGVPSSGTDRAFGSGNCGHSEMTIDEEPLAHSVLDVTLDGRPMEGISVPEPLEHSVGGGGGGWTADSWRGCHI